MRAQRQHEIVVGKLSARFRTDDLLRPVNSIYFRVEMDFDIRLVVKTVGFEVQTLWR